MAEFAFNSLQAVWDWDALWALRVPIVVIWAVILLAAAIALIIEGLIALVVIGIILLIRRLAEPIFSTASIVSLGSLMPTWTPPPIN